MYGSKSLRVSVMGAVVALLSLVSLLFLPAIVGVVGVVIGGMALWGGFIATLFHYYDPSSTPPPADG